MGPLAKDPLARSAYNRARYRRNPAYRLDCINRTRARRNMPPVEDLSQVKTRGN
jgi:hypothetical protein